MYSCASNAIDIALSDIKGKFLHMPVYKLLGGPVRDKVVRYTHAQGPTIDTLVENCVSQVEEGWKFRRWVHQETHLQFEQQGTGLLEPVESMRIAEEQMARVREAV